MQLRKILLAKTTTYQLIQTNHQTIALKIS